MANESALFERRVVQKLLRTGLACSLALMLAGLLAPVFGLDGHSSYFLLLVGVVVLALTPVLRIFTLIFLWAREGDWKFILVGVAVLASLLASVGLSVFQALH